MKEFFIRQAISTLLAFCYGLDKDNSVIIRWRKYLEPLRDELINLYPLEK